MKNIKFILLILLEVTIAGIILYSCNSTTIPKQETIIVRDTVYITINNTDSTTIDSLSDENRKLKEDLFVANYKLERIKSYTDIVDRNSSQIKFYKGWIKRVLNNN